MNADLADVNRRYGGGARGGQPLRNRSASSNSGDGRPDPNRYKKYLSLRNRKIIENKERGASGQVRLADSDSHRTASHRTLEQNQFSNNVTAMDNHQPLQPILKSTSSRVSDLRYRDGGGTLSKSQSQDSMPETTAQQNQHQSANHSPLRVKSRSPVSEKQKSSERRERSPIQIYKCEKVDEEQKRMGPYNSTADIQHHHHGSQHSLGARSKMQQHDPYGKSSVENRSISRHDPFKSQTTEMQQNDEAADFNFDFDQDGECSYINTTMQSAQTTPNEARVAAKMQNTAAAAVTTKTLSKPSIMAFAEELKDSVKYGVESDKPSDDDEDDLQESSGYVIDYEQVLRDNSNSLKNSSSNNGFSRPTPPHYESKCREDDIAQNTILEQTQEANETDSSPRSRRKDQDAGDDVQDFQIRSGRSHRSSQQSYSKKSSAKKSMRQQDSPQFKEVVEVIKERRGRKESPQMVSAELHQSSTQQQNYHNLMESRVSDKIKSANDYKSQYAAMLLLDQREEEIQQQCQDQILTFEHRQPASASSLRSSKNSAMVHDDINEHQNVRQPSYLGACQTDSVETGSFKIKAPGKSNSKRHQQLDHDDERIDSAVDTERDDHQQDDVDEEDHETQESYGDDDRQKNNFNSSYGVMDLERSNKKIKERNDEIANEFEQQCYGSSPPSSKLVVTCIIRQPMETVGVKSKYHSMRSESVNILGTTAAKTTNLSHGAYSGSIIRDNNGSVGGGKHSSQGPAFNRHGLNRSQNGLLDITTHKSSSLSGNRTINRIRGHSHDSRSNHSAGGKRHKQQQQHNTPNQATSKSGVAAKESQITGNKHPHILTTQTPSRFVLRSPPGLQSSLLNILLKSEQDMTHCQLAFDEHGLQSKAKGHKSMKVFEFDNCIGETKAHSLSMGLEQHVKWITQTSPPIKMRNSNQPTLKGRQTASAKNVIFLFGQSDALKTQLLNVMQPNSLISQCLKAHEIRFFRMSTYHLNQEYLLAHKSFGSKQQMRREIGMELREAFRERDLNAKKIALKLSTYSKTIKAEDIKLSSHLIIQLDDLVFVDLADIDNLKDPSLAKKISADFSVVTNAILSISSFYKDHDFGAAKNDSEDRISPYQEKSNNFRTGSLTFKSQINRLITKQSRVLLLCCVIQCSNAGTQAVDYCHKIRTYYHGTASGQDNSIQQTPTRRMQQAAGDISMDTDQNVNAFKQLGGLISEVSKARLFIDKVFQNKTRGEPLKRSRNQLKEMVACLRDDVSDLLNTLAANNESYVHQLKKIRELLQQEIFYMREKVAAMRSAVRRNNSIGGSSRKSGGHALCLLPRNILQQHSSAQVKKVGQQNSNTNSSNMLLKRANTPKSSSNRRLNSNNRPQSQTSFNSGHHQPPLSSSANQRRLMDKNNQGTSNSRRGSVNNLHHQSNGHGSQNGHVQNHTSRMANKSSSQTKRATQQKVVSKPAPQILFPRMPFHSESNTNMSNMKKSHDSLPHATGGGASCGNRRQSSISQKSTGIRKTASNITPTSNKGKKTSVSRNNLQQQTSSGTAGKFASRTQISNKNNDDLIQVEYEQNQSKFGASKRNQSGHKDVQIYKDKQLSMRDSDNCNSNYKKNDIIDLVQIDQMSAPTETVEDYRTKTMNSNNHHHQYLLSGTKSTMAANIGSIIKESTQMTPGIAVQEQLHYDVFSLKEQLRQAIVFSEDQTAKRKQAEENCIKLTKELTQTETHVHDLEDRIIAKDQTIRSLESQVDFLKNKVTVSANTHETLGVEPFNNGSSNQEIDKLRYQKAETNQTSNIAANQGIIAGHSWQSYNCVCFHLKALLDNCGCQKICPQEREGRRQEPRELDQPRKNGRKPTF